MKNYKFKIRGTEYEVEIKSHENNEINLEVNGTAYKVEVEREVKVSKTPKLVRPKAAPAEAQTNVAPQAASGSGTPVNAPLPGNIFKINVSQGADVKKGDVLLIMEAMKMENNVLAEKDGKVGVIKVKEGDAVLQNDVLMELI